MGFAFAFGNRVCERVVGFAFAFGNRVCESAVGFDLCSANAQQNNRAFSFAVGRLPRSEAKASGPSPENRARRPELQNRFGGTGFVARVFPWLARQRRARGTRGFCIYVRQTRLRTGCGFCICVRQTRSRTIARFRLRLGRLPGSGAKTSGPSPENRARRPELQNRFGGTGFVARVFPWLARQRRARGTRGFSICVGQTRSRTIVRFRLRLGRLPRSGAKASGPPPENRARRPELQNRRRWGVFVCGWGDCQDQGQRPQVPRPKTGREDLSYKTVAGGAFSFAFGGIAKIRGKGLRSLARKPGEKT